MRIDVTAGAISFCACGSTVAVVPDRMAARSLTPARISPCLKAPNGGCRLGATSAARSNTLSIQSLPAASSPSPRAQCSTGRRTSPCCDNIRLYKVLRLRQARVGIRLPAEAHFHAATPTAFGLAIAASSLAFRLWQYRGFAASLCLPLPSVAVRGCTGRAGCAHPRPAAPAPARCCPPSRGPIARRRGISRHRP